MSINLAISEICYKFKELINKQLQTKIAMTTEDKVTEIFCMADNFCKFFDTMTAKYTLKPTGKRKYHRNSTTTKVEVMQTKATSARTSFKGYSLTEYSLLPN